MAPLRATSWKSGKSDPMASGTGVDGLPDLVDRLDRAHDGLLDLTEPNRPMAAVAASDADAGVPRATGFLASTQAVTVTATGWGITYAAPYAVPVHFGTQHTTARPWLLIAAHDTENKQLDILQEHVQRLLD